MSAQHSSFTRKHYTQTNKTFKYTLHTLITPKSIYTDIYECIKIKEMNKYEEWWIKVYHIHIYISISFWKTMNYNEKCQHTKK